MLKQKPRLLLFLLFTIQVYSSFALAQMGITAMWKKTVWKKMSLDGAPPVLFRPGLTTLNNKLFFWGGALNYSAAGIYSNNGYTYDMTTRAWSQIPSLNAPTGRAGATLVSTNNKVVVYGGYTYGSPPQSIANGGIFDTITNTWSTIPSAGAPSPRLFNLTEIVNNKLYIWGGGDGWSTCLNHFFNDGKFFDLTTNGWNPIPTTPSWRYPTGVSFTNYIFIYGGKGCNSISGSMEIVLSDAFLLNTTTNSWSSVSTIGSPGARFWTKPVFDSNRNKIYIWGGRGPGGGPTNSFHAYDISSNTWDTLPTAGGPPPIYAVQFLVNSKLIVWNSYFVQGYVFNFSTNSWSKLSVTGAPLPSNLVNSFHYAVPTNTGAIYIWPDELTNSNQGYIITP